MHWGLLGLRQVLATRKRDRSRQAGRPRHRLSHVKEDLCVAGAGVLRKKEAKTPGNEKVKMETDSAPRDLEPSVTMGMLRGRDRWGDRVTLCISEFCNQVLLKIFRK